MNGKEMIAVMKADNKHSLPMLMQLQACGLAGEPSLKWGENHTW
jgi:hypothetical protein